MSGVSVRRWGLWDVALTLEVCVRFLTGYVGSRMGLVTLALAGAAFGLFLKRGEKHDRAGHRAVAGQQVAPEDYTEETAAQYCRKAGWPDKPLPVPDLPARLPRILPGAFPSVGTTLPAQARGLVSLKKELEAPGLPRVRRANVTLRLARGYAIRALYFRARLSRRVGGQPLPRPVFPRTAGPDRSGSGKSAREARRRRHRRRHSAGPFAGPMSRQRLLRGYRAAIRASDFYYRDLMSRKYKRGSVVLDQVLYEHASLLLLAGHPDRAVEELENLVVSVPESRFATYAKAVIAVAAARKKACVRAIRLASKLDLDSLGMLGSLAGLVAGRCMLASKDPARAVGWLTKVVHSSVKNAVGAEGSKDEAGVGPARSLLLGACRALARALSRTAQPDNAVRQAMGLPQPASAIVLSELQRAYGMRKMYREQVLVCRKAGTVMAKKAPSVAKVLASWLPALKTRKDIGPVELRPVRKKRGAQRGGGAIGSHRIHRRRRGTERKRGPGGRDSGRAPGG